MARLNAAAVMVGIIRALLDQPTLRRHRQIIRRHVGHRSSIFEGTGWIDGVGQGTLLALPSHPHQTIPQMRFGCI